jgi:Cu/Ag efflux pump CusA
MLSATHENGTVLANPNFADQLFPGFGVFGDVGQVGMLQRHSTGARFVAVTCDAVLIQQRGLRYGAGFGGLELTTFKQAGETYDVIAQLSRPERSNPRDLYGVYVRGSGNALVPLASMVSVKETVAPRGLPHFDRFRSATVGAYLAQGLPLGTAIDQIRAIAEDVLPAGEGYRYTFAGEVRGLLRVRQRARALPTCSRCW